MKKGFWQRRKNIRYTDVICGDRTYILDSNGFLFDGGFGPFCCQNCGMIFAISHIPTNCPACGNEVFLSKTALCTVNIDAVVKHDWHNGAGAAPPLTLETLKPRKPVSGEYLGKGENMTEADARIVFERLPRDALIVALDDIAYMHRMTKLRIEVTQGAIESYLDAVLSIVCDKSINFVLEERGIKGPRKDKFYDFVLSKKFILLKQVRDKFHI